jgi:hypothetical protein
VRRELVLLLAALALLAPPARAGEGVVLITQADALAGGVTPSDTAGFPVTLDTSGSYRLAGDLTVASTSADGIEITADEVTLDLGGFAIQGPITCTGEGSALSCGAGSGRGVDASGQARITLRNGSVRGFGSDGVFVGGADSRAVGLTVEENGNSGIVLSGGIVRDCVASRNGNAGIVPAFVPAPSVVVGNTAVGNQGRGISSNEGAVVMGNSALRNGTAGIAVFSGTAVHRNSSRQNEGDGILVKTFANTTSITLNSLTDNGGYGISTLNSSDAYGYNVIDTDTGSTGTVGGSGTNLGNNACDGSTTCP